MYPKGHVEAMEVATYAATARQPDWMEGLARRINRFLGVAGDETVVVFDGDTLQIRPRDGGPLPMKASDVTAGTRVAAISLWEPWATLMAIGAKKNETRSWPTRHRGALLVCAAARKNNKEMRELLGISAFSEALAGGLTKMWHGHAVALVDLDHCLRTTPGLNAWPVSASLSLNGDEMDFGDYAPGRFAWITTGLRRLKPFPVKGKQRIFYVTMPPEFEEWS